LDQAVIGSRFSAEDPIPFNYSDFLRVKTALYVASLDSIHGRHLLGMSEQHPL
jgi:hypothetical protein